MPKMKYLLLLLAGGILTAGVLMAQQPNWAGPDRGGKNEPPDRRIDKKADGAEERKGDVRDVQGGARDNENRSEQRPEQKSEQRNESNDRNAPAAARRGDFEERHRTIVRDYYEESFRGGHCPPGLAKKNNGCMPPGQARKWQYGRALPRDVVYYEVPQALVVQLGAPRAGYRYVRVGIDILLIAIATGFVVDAVEDMGR